MEIIGYARGVGEDLRKQVENLKAAHCTRLLIDESVLVTDQQHTPDVIAQAMKPGDVLQIRHLSTLGLSTQALLRFLVELDTSGKHLQVDVIGIDWLALVYFAKIMLDMDAERLAMGGHGGEALAKESGKKRARTNRLNKDQEMEVLALATSTPMTVDQIAAQFDVGRMTVYRILQRHPQVVRE